MEAVLGTTCHNQSPLTAKITVYCNVPPSNVFTTAGGVRAGPRVTEQCCFVFCAQPIPVLLYWLSMTEKFCYMCYYTCIHVYPDGCVCEYLYIDAQTHVLHACVCINLLYTYESIATSVNHTAFYVNIPVWQKTLRPQVQTARSERTHKHTYTPTSMLVPCFWHWSLRPL